MIIIYTVEKIVEKVLYSNSTNFVEIKYLNRVKKELKNVKYNMYEPFIGATKVILYNKMPNIKIYEIISSNDLRHQDILGTRVFPKPGQRIRIVRIRFDTGNVRIEHHPRSKLLIHIQHPLRIRGQGSVLERHGLDAKAVLGQGHQEHKDHAHRKEPRSNVEPGPFFPVPPAKQDSQDGQPQRKGTNAEHQAAHGQFRQGTAAQDPACRQQREENAAAGSPRRKGPAFFPKHPVQIPANQAGQGRGKDEHVRNLLRLGDAEKQEDESRPHFQEEQDLPLVRAGFGNPVLHGLEQKTCPGEHPQQDNGDIKPPVHARRMERLGKTLQVVEA